MREPALTRREPRLRRREPQFLMRVWDAPTRLFHWAVVLLVIASYATAKAGWMKWHFLSGYAMLTLLLFRLVWGFIGSDTSRFARFLRSPVAGLRHIARFGQREPDTEIGHNAAGGWMVLVMLALLLAQAATGLFANDDPGTKGPLYHDVSKALSDRLSTFHEFNFNLILAAIALHLLAILAYAAVKRQNLVRPMITGRKRLPGTLRPPRMQNPFLALALLVLAGLLVWVLVTRA